ncbi:MAG: hypothetical protein KatS3mg110_3029 [Pirellulaceae bacterium]|nr:MAG: hypothetical protein KatS3mg110_3029 [Pirellulaceae bacterium]
MARLDSGQCLFLAIVWAACLSGTLEKEAHCQSPQIWLRSSAEVGSGFVRLRDIAELRGWESSAAQPWEAVPLWPAPSEGQRRLVRARDVQELLALHGLPLERVEFGGANQIEIRTGPPARAPGPIQPAKDTAQNTLPVVVAARPLRAGQILASEDLLLENPPASGRTASRSLTRIEDAIGRELLQSVSAGQVLDGAWLRKPILVRRGQVVTISSRAAGVVVRLPGRALEDGSLDDLVSVQWLDDRSKQLVARVTGIDSVEVVPLPLTTGR